MGYTVELRKEIWNDVTGSKITVGPDRDGLELVELRQFTADGKGATSLTMTQEEALLVAEAIKYLYAI